MSYPAPAAIDGGPLVSGQVFVVPADSEVVP